MKKVYTAPQILFESFTMSTNIAAGCDEIIRTFDKGSCAIEGTGGIKLFAADMPGICEFTPEGMGGVPDMYDGLCYHVPTEDANLFAS